MEHSLDLNFWQELIFISVLNELGRWTERKCGYSPVFQLEVAISPEIMSSDLK